MQTKSNDITEDIIQVQDSQRKIISAIKKLGLSKTKTGETDSNLNLKLQLFNTTVQHQLKKLHKVSNKIDHKLTNLDAILKQQLLKQNVHVSRLEPVIVLIFRYLHTNAIELAKGLYVVRSFFGLKLV